MGRKVWVRAFLRATQDFLRDGIAANGIEKTLQTFESQHGIRGKVEHGLLMLDYSQILVKWAEPFGYVCRGLILDAETFEVVSMPLSKIFNSGEHYAAPIDWATARIYTKVDGSMLGRFWNERAGEFQCHTRFQLPASLKTNQVNGDPITWEKMIARCFVGWEEILAAQPHDQTWGFEICGQHNRVVVRYDDYSAKLLAARNNLTLREIPLEDLPAIQNGKPQAYRFNNAAEVAEFANTFKAIDNEGFVVCDGDFNRIKIKSDQYVMLHRAKDGLRGINNLIEIARGNDYEEITTHFPEFKDDLDAVSGIMQECVERHERALEGLAGIVAQKDFALEIAKLGLESPSTLFLTRAGKQPGVRVAFAAMNDTTFCKLFKAKVRLTLGEKYAEIPETPTA